jgi:Terpene synthase family 2, C-terminal metal binding
MLSLGDIQRLLPNQESIYADAAEQRVNWFVSQWHVKPQHFDDYNTMSRFLYSRAVSADRLQATCTIHSMFFFIDDLFFDTDRFDARDFSIAPEIGRDLRSVSQFLSTLMHIFKTGELPTHPTAIQMAFYEMGELVAGQAPDEWFTIFADGIQDYIKAVIQREVDLRRGKTVLTDLDSFLDIRLRDTGGLHTCQLIEFTKNAFLPADVRNHDQIRYLTWLAIAMASLVNDVFSYHKDVVLEGSDFNLVKILMDLHGLSFDRAVDESVRLVNSYADRFVEAREELPSWGHEVDRIVEQYVDGLAEMMSGNVYWHGTTNRYRSPESPFPELREMTAAVAAGV